MSNEHIATFTEPQYFNRMRACKYLKANGWKLKEGWPLVTSFQSLLATPIGRESLEVMGPETVVDTTGQGAQVIVNDVLLAGYLK